MCNLINTHTHTHKKERITKKTAITGTRPPIILVLGLGPYVLVPAWGSIFLFNYEVYYNEGSEVLSSVELIIQYIT